MTVSPDVPRLVFDDLAGAVRAIREAGLRLSTPRRLLLEAMFAAQGPVSAVHLARTVSIDESSVYRNLEVLEGHGLIRHVHLGHGPGLYVLLGRDEVEYLYCERCAKVTPVSPERLDTARREIKQALGYEARFTHFAIVGLCEPCAAQKRPSSKVQSDPENRAADDHRHHQHGEPTASRRDDEASHEHTHSHGEFVHSHPHAHREMAARHEH